MDSLSLLELNALVRRSLEQCLPDEYWIQAELSDVRSNTTGHCYLEFVQKDPRSNNLVAKARGMIWSNIYRLLKPYFEETTGQLFASGIKVLVKVTVQFHELYGYSLTVLDIDPAYTLGDMARRRREILMQLEEEGVLTLNKELEMPVLPQRIAVISSATAAGYGDFCHQLQHNSGGFFFYTELFPALMQGNQVEESVLAALDRINDRVNEFDVVVIIRGGGATSDLSGFDTYLCGRLCPVPVARHHRYRSRAGRYGARLCGTYPGEDSDGCCRTSDSPDHRIGRSSGRVIRPSATRGVCPARTGRTEAGNDSDPHPEPCSPKTYRCPLCLAGSRKRLGASHSDPVVPSSSPAGTFAATCGGCFSRQTAESWI